MKKYMILILILSTGCARDCLQRNAYIADRCMRTCDSSTIGWWKIDKKCMQKCIDNMSECNQ